jgi:hypothetical protein
VMPWWGLNIGVSEPGRAPVIKSGADG